MNCRGLLVCILFTIVAGSSLVHANEGGARQMNSTDSEYTVGDVIDTYQKWHTKNNSAVLNIYEVNKADSTFAGTYQIIRSLDDFYEFPFHGQYNPKGITLGWIVSYWSTFEYRNNHTVVAWAGSLRPGETYKAEWILSATQVSYDFMSVVDDIFILDHA